MLMLRKDTNRALSPSTSITGQFKSYCTVLFLLKLHEPIKSMIL